MLILVALAWLYRGRIADVFFTKKVSPALIATSPCAGKSMCAVVYIAPWCPACHMIQPELVGLLKNAKLPSAQGLVVVVGRGQTPEENEAKARELGKGAIVDTKSEWHEALRIKKYPSFLVIDRSKKVTLEDEGARAWINENFVPLL